MLAGMIDKTRTRTQPKANARTAEERQKGGGKRAVQLRPEVEANGASLQQGARHAWAPIRLDRLARANTAKPADATAYRAKSQMLRVRPVTHADARRSGVPIFSSGHFEFREKLGRWRC